MPKLITVGCVTKCRFPIEKGTKTKGDLFVFTGLFDNYEEAAAKVTEHVLKDLRPDTEIIACKAFEVDANATLQAAQSIVKPEG